MWIIVTSKKLIDLVNPCHVLIVPFSHSKLLNGLPVSFRAFMPDVNCELIIYSTKKMNTLGVMSSTGNKVSRVHKFGWVFSLGKMPWQHVLGHLFSSCQDSTTAPFCATVGKGLGCCKRSSCTQHVHCFHNSPATTKPSVQKRAFLSCSHNCPYLSNLCP